MQLTFKQEGERKLARISITRGDQERLRETDLYSKRFLFISVLNYAAYKHQFAISLLLLRGVFILVTFIFFNVV